MTDEKTHAPFATVDDMKARWLDFPAGQERLAEVLIADASQYIVDVVPEAVNASPATLKRVVCAVVRRAMMAENDALIGSTQVQVAAGPFSQSFQPSNPHGDLFLTAQERRALGYRRQRAFSFSMLPDDDEMAEGV